ncbi:MAG: type II toxin-antitoxin system VapC family toxin [Candidatus Limnocylindrales bacterium]
MSYLFDTTVVIDWSLARPGIQAVVEACMAETDLLYTCDVVTSEALSGGSDAERVIVKHFLDALEFVALDPDGAAEAGELRRRAGRTSGRSLGHVLIAALALRLGATIVTRNEADYTGLGVAVLSYGASAT